MTARIAVGVAEAASMVGVSEKTIRRAVANTDPKTFPYHLPAKRDSKGRLSIKVTALEAWHDRWEDA